MSDSLALITILNKKCRAPFHDCLCRLLSNGPVKCLISDVLFYSSQDVARQLRLPTIAFRSNGATAAVAIAGSPVSLESSHPVLPLRAKDMPDFSSREEQILDQLRAGAKKAAGASPGVPFNTFESLEPDALEKLRQDLHLVPVFAVGPLHKFSPGSSNSFPIQDRSCMGWLDKKAPKSVVYVSFGSLASIEKEQVVEIARALANSHLPFLWVVRPGLIRGYDWIELPDGFEKTTRERGRIVKWAPQQEVLVHLSVGGFWTHNGWNSTMESICEGVPMICCPCCWDQNVNARYVSHVWKVGVQLENEIQRDEISKAIKRLMVEAECEEIRERINHLKEDATSSMRKGGSSYKSF